MCLLILLWALPYKMVVERSDCHTPLSKSKIKKKEKAKEYKIKSSLLSTTLTHRVFLDVEKEFHEDTRKSSKKV